MKIIYYCRRLVCTLCVRLKVTKCGKQLRVNHWSSISKHTTLGNYVNFNGMKIRGGGKVTIGDHFHSGRDCLIISQNHNYDAGNAIPYDDTCIYKDVTIGDNVWIGDRVIILGE